jgi:hypothetical protein
MAQSVGVRYRASGRRSAARRSRGAVTALPFAEPAGPIGIPPLRRGADEIVEHAPAVAGGRTGSGGAVELAHPIAAIASFAPIAAGLTSRLAPDADPRHLLSAGRVAHPFRVTGRVAVSVGW